MKIFDFFFFNLAYDTSINSINSKINNHVSLSDPEIYGTRINNFYGANLESDQLNYTPQGFSNLLLMIYICLFLF
jgi:hypothetical protein